MFSVLKVALGQNTYLFFFIVEYDHHENNENYMKIIRNLISYGLYYAFFGPNISPSTLRFTIFNNWFYNPKDQILYNLLECGKVYNN